MPSEPKEIVVLLHGLGHSMLNMELLARALKKRGYETLNISYPSLQNDIKSLSKWLNKKLTDERVWERSDKIHFVTLSMGGLVAGFYLQDFEAQIRQNKIGRVVMLGPPHGGSEIADRLQGFWLYKFIFGPAGQELGTEIRQQDRITPTYELGIIAGTQNWMYPLGKAFIKSPHDGCVSVESTKLGGMKDHIILSVMHLTMGWSSKVRDEVIYFLQNGAFKHG